MEKLASESQNRATRAALTFVISGSDLSIVFDIIMTQGTVKGTLGGWIPVIFSV